METVKELQVHLNTAWTTGFSIAQPNYDAASVGLSPLCVHVRDTYVPNMRRVHLNGTIPRDWQ